MNIVNLPNAVQAGFNPILVKVSGNYNEQARIAVSVTDSFGNQQDIPFERVIHTPEYQSHVATFNIAAVLNRQFVNRVTVDNDRYFVNSLLCQRCGIVSPVVYYFLVLNAVRQFGESTDLTSLRGTFLSQAKVFKKYDGYPLSISVLGFPDKTYINDMVADELGVTEDHFNLKIKEATEELIISNKSLYSELTNNEGTNITNNAGVKIIVKDIKADTILSRTLVKGECLYKNPFYVRWVNTSGGYEHFMFLWNQKISLDLKKLETVQKYYLDSATIDNNTEIVNIETEKTITFGVSNLDKDEYDLVLGVVVSPYVEYFNTKKQAWERIYQSKVTGNDSTNDTIKSIEFECTFNNLLTQV